MFGFNYGCLLNKQTNKLPAARAQDGPWPVRGLSEGGHVQSTMAMDEKGVKRGRCKDPLCSDDCLSFEYVPSRGPQCNNCGCYPAKHKRIEEISVKEEIIFEETESQDNINSVSQDCTAGLQERSSHGNEMITMMNLNSASGTTTLNIDAVSGGLVRISPIHVSHFNHQTITEDNFALSTTPEGLNYGNSITSTPVEPINSVRRQFLPSPFRNLNGEAQTQGDLSVSTIEVGDSQNVAPVPANRIPAFVSCLSRQQLYQLCVPFALPDDSIDRSGGSISTSSRQFVLRWIVMAMKNYNLVSDTDFVEVAKLTLEKHPQLRSSVCKGTEGLVATMKTIGRNHAYYQARKYKASGATYIPPKESHLPKTIEQIQCEMASGNPSVASLKALLSSCRIERKKMARKEHCATHLRSFPALELDDLLFWEFCQQEDIQESKEYMRMRWINLLPYMCHYFSKKESMTPLPITPDHATIEILKRMVTSSFFGSKKSSNKRTGFLIEVFKEKTPLLETLPDKDDPPRLIAIGDVEKEAPSVSIYVDGRAIYTGSVVDSLIQLVAMYWVFQIVPPADVRASIAFLGGVVLKNKAESDYRKFNSVIKALEALPVL